MTEQRLLPDWIDTYMKYVDNTEPPDSYKKWAAISCIASCLKRECSLEWEGTLYPNLYIILVGPSGARKGTAMKPVLKMLRRASIYLSPESVTREQLIRRLRKAGEQLVEEGSVSFSSSMTIFSQELTVFLGYNNQQLMADLCDWYDCGDNWKYETKGQGQDDIDNVWVNFIGATTPRLLQSTLPQDAIGGGLTSRIIFVYEPKKGKSIATPFKTEEEIRLEELLQHDLEAIKTMHGEFRPDDDFLQKYIPWYEEQDKNPIFNDPRLEGYLTRRATHLRKIAMVVSASRGNDMILTGHDFDRALRELVMVERNMPYTFRGIGQSNLVEATDRIMTTIAMNGEISFNALLGRHYHDVTKDELHKIVSALVTMEDRQGKKAFKWKDDSFKSGIIQYVK